MFGTPGRAVKCDAHCFVFPCLVDACCCVIVKTFLSAVEFWMRWKCGRISIRPSALLSSVSLTLNYF